MKVKVYRPVICPQCRADVHLDEEEDCLVVMHCVTCGRNFVVHLVRHVRDVCLIFD